MRINKYQRNPAKEVPNTTKNALFCGLCKTRVVFMFDKVLKMQELVTSVFRELKLEIFYPYRIAFLESQFP